MGKNHSKEAEPQATPSPTPRQIFSQEPFRKVKWGKSSRDEIKANLAGLRPDTNLNVSAFNIVLMGEVGSGKSSFFNSIYSIMKDEVIIKCPVGKQGKRITKEFLRYDLGKDISITIGDTMGVQKNTGEADIMNILRVVDGHVPNGHRFTPNEVFYCERPGYIASPTIAEKAHCVALVINAKESYFMPPNIVQKLQSLAEGLSSRAVPFIVLLTHLDEFCEDVKKDITKTFHAIPLENLMNKISFMLNGLPKNQIYPVINYKDESHLDDNMDVLLLYALRTMVLAAQAHLETIKSLQKQSSESSSQLN